MSLYGIEIGHARCRRKACKTLPPKTELGKIYLFPYMLFKQSKTKNWF
jgi:hypothetical protein